MITFTAIQYEKTLKHCPPPKKKKKENCHNEKYAISKYSFVMKTIFCQNTGSGQRKIMAERCHRKKVETNHLSKQ